ncbi:MFS transporter, NNP family, nitrate/nitrite transporter [Modicisalibacter ilicicola DSM 19980]|uniref:MFS transporter, NNP family, nitrate/nitrite transporter n=1 Tax=Modicisalibacter ilicicola DSM 19980 TaxID=1121942 RepID=A0A1M4WCX0_9GAMM|nr:MFS transporter [Halomonas ilicicola]SHE79076.1 MFS transporter, NNP family, nitrate/nitrite transporter [Halomonas ilicicola DSM 19980]
MTMAREAPSNLPTNGYQPLVVVVLSPLTFALVFACWTLFAVLGMELKRALGFDDIDFAILLATPMLAGAVASLPMARLAQWFGGRRVMLGCLLLACPFLWWISIAEHYIEFLLAGAGLGLGAGSLAAGLVYVAAWGPRGRIGLALGLYGAGMLGAGLSYLLLPLASQAYGWRLAPKLYLLPVLLVALLLWLFAEDEAYEDDAASDGPEENANRRARRRRWQRLLAALVPPASWQLWRLAIYYSFFYGAFVALALWLPSYLSAQYQLSLQQAAQWALLFILSGGAGQIVGGLLADRRDFRALRWWVSALVLVCLFLLSYPPFSIQIQGVHGEVAFSFNMPLSGFIALLSSMGFAMGVGKGSLMRTIYRDHGDDMARIGGLALTLGGMFACVLPLVFVIGNEWIGIRSVGFMFLYGALAVCMLVMLWDHASTTHSRR